MTKEQWIEFIRERREQIKKYSMGVGLICLDMTLSKDLLEMLENDEKRA